VRACPFGVPFINADGTSEIDPARCQGCGICASECPAKAIQLQQFQDDQILAKLNGLLERMSA
jgi:heterodisulfide reductase subunit A